MRKLAFGVVSLISAYPALASHENIIIPSEFQSMFDQEESSISFHISGLDASRHIAMISTPFETQLLSKSEQALSQLLVGQGLKASAVSDILTSLKAGVRNDPLCSGIASECQLIPEYFSFGYDYERQSLTLFVNANAFVKASHNQEPHGSRNRAPGFVNHIDLDVNAYQESDVDLTLRNESILGLPYGNITSKLYANTDDDVDIDELAYNYEWDKQRLQVGHYEYGYAQNTTSTLDLTGSYPLDAITLSSSRNLLNKDKQASRTLNYVLPSQGRIEVYRNEQLVFSKNVPAGQQVVNYSDLPTGNYLATVVILSQGREVLKEQRQIYNTALFSLSKGEVDYALTAGKFNARYDDNSDFDVLALSADEFIDGRINYQLFDNTSVGARSVVTQDHSMIEGGLSQDIGSYVSATAKFAQFDNDGRFWSVDSAFLGMSIGYEVYSLSNDDYALNNYLLGNSGYQRLTASTSLSVAGGSGYLMYIDNHADDPPQIGEQFNDQTSYWSLTAGYSRPFIADSTIDISATWQGGDDEFYNEDEWYVNVLWSVPLGSEWTANSSTSLSGQGVDEFRNSVVKSTSGEDYYANSEIGVAYVGNSSPQEMTTDVSFSGGYTSDGFNSDTYAYAKSDGTRSLNLGLSSSQVFDGEKLHFSSERSDAYIVVNADNNNDPDSHLGLLTIARDGDISHNKNVDAPQTVIGVENYTQYQVKLDTSSSNYLVNGQSNTQEYTFPGSVVPLNVDLTKIKTFITSFENIQGQQVDDVRCVGDGCIEVESLTEGVFKVSVIVGADYQLVSNTQTCLTPTLDRATSQVVNIGENYCLPGIDTETTQLALLQKTLIDNESYYFVGVYDNQASLKAAAERLDAVGLEAISRQVNARHYLYANTHNTLTSAQASQLESLWQYAVRSLEAERWALWR